MRVSASRMSAAQKRTGTGRESGGPSVVTPTHRGFGLGLLHRALDQFNGSVDMTFEKPGLVCELKAAVPKNMASLLAQAETVEIEQSR